MLTDGSYRMSQTQAAECIDDDPVYARNFLIAKPFKSLRGGGYTPDSIESKTLETALANLGEGFAIDDEIRRERDYYESLLKQNGIEPYNDRMEAQARIFYSG
jgi:hypothetical protein